MATLNAKVTLSSSDLGTSNLSLAVTKPITITGGGVKTVKITGTNSGTANLIYTADDFAAPMYLYLKNLDTTASDFLWVIDDTSTGDPIIAKLAGGDWAFLPNNADKTYKVYATTTGTMLEFGIFGTDQ